MKPINTGRLFELNLTTGCNKEDGINPLLIMLLLLKKQSLLESPQKDLTFSALSDTKLYTSFIDYYFIDFTFYMLINNRLNMKYRALNFRHFHYQLTAGSAMANSMSQICTLQNLNRQNLSFNFHPRPEFCFTLMVVLSKFKVNGMLHTQFFSRYFFFSTNYVMVVVMLML